MELANFLEGVARSYAVNEHETLAGPHVSYKGAIGGSINGGWRDMRRREARALFPHSTGGGCKGKISVKSGAPCDGLKGGGADAPVLLLTSRVENVEQRNLAVDRRLLTIRVLDRRIVLIDEMRLDELDRCGLGEPGAGSDNELQQRRAEGCGGRKDRFRVPTDWAWIKERKRTGTEW